MSIDDADLLAYVDGQLPAQRRSEVEAAVAGDTELVARVAALRASVLPYAAAFDSQQLPPLPPQLSASVAALLDDSRLSGRSRRQRTWPRMAAAFAAGVLCCAVALNLLSGAGTPMSAAAQVSPWIKAVADYQQLYSRATVADVTEDPQLSTRVIADLRATDGLSVQVPDLRSAGLAFKRVQRLSFHQQPVVQMVYLPAQGEPVALCVTADARADESPHMQQLGELNAVTWRRNNLGYVLLGKASAATLLDLGHQLANDHSGTLYGWIGSGRRDAAT
jgi:anti-sigma factor RsiW